MFKPMTAEQVLKAIYEAHADAFSDSRRLSALFADYSGGRLKAQQNQLDIFLKCDGNTCILNLRNAPKQKQQTEYHRLIQEMVCNYGMQEEVALKVSGAFWRVVVSTEPPISKPVPEPKQQPVTSTPAAEPQIYDSQEVSRDYTAKTAEAEQIHEHKAQASVQTTASPAMEQRNGMGKRIVQHFREMAIVERVTFLIGLCGIVLHSPAFVSACYDTVIAGTDLSAVLSTSIVPLLAIWRLCLLWKRGFGSLFSGGFLEKVDCAYSKVLMWPNMLGCIISVVAIFFAFVDGWGDGVWTNIFITAFLAGNLAFSVFNTIWHWEKWSL